MCSMPARGYIAGKPVSRWEASDSDNIDIEYKNLDRPGKQHWCAECFSGPKGLVLKALVLLLIFVLGLVFGYVVRKTTCEGGQDLRLPGPRFVLVQQDYDPRIREELQGRIGHIANFEDSIRTVTKSVPMSGGGETNRLLYYTHNFWDTEHLDSTTIRNYSVQLMYPNYTMEGVNRVSLISGNETIFHTHTNGTHIHPNYLPFCAFSLSAHVQGNLVYAHYGRRADFDKLKELGVEVNNTILLIRYGHIHPSNKVRRAEDAGALGVILYPDPQDYAGGSSNVANDSWWLPGDAVVRSSVRYWLTGDPLTPDYPALDGIPRLNDSSHLSSYPQLPVFPISYNDAHQLMINMSGSDVPKDWVGGLDVPYKTGPGFEDNRQVDLNVKNDFTFREIHNIIATIYGQYEKDQYVIVGAHIDSFTKGAIDAGTGYAVLMDLVRTFSQQRRCSDWRPRRTIIFAGWDASKYGHYGAFEWAQEYEQQLSAGAVAYINLDAAVRGNYSFYAEANPLLYDVIYAATKTVESPDSDDGKTVYEDWKKKLARPEFLENRPWISDLPGDSDHSPFLYRLGISSMSAAFTYNIKEYDRLPTYPVYGSLNDTYEYFHEHVDPHFNVTTALVRVLCDIVLRLSDSAVLPFNVRGYSVLLERGRKSLYPHQGRLKEAGLDLDLLTSAIKNFQHSADIFHTNYTSSDIKNLSEFEARFMNDKMLRVSRAFIHSGAEMSQPWYRNVLIAPHPENLNQEVVFPGLITALVKADKDDTSWRSHLRRQFAIVVVCLQRARTILLESYPAQSFNDSW